MHPRTAKLVAAIALSFMQDSTWKNRKHWELAIGRVRLDRWCIGAPCHLTNNKKHPVRPFRIRKL